MLIMMWIVGPPSGYISYTVLGGASKYYALQSEHETLAMLLHEKDKFGFILSRSSKLVSQFQFEVAVQNMGFVLQNDAKQLQNLDIQ